MTYHKYPIPQREPLTRIVRDRRMKRRKGKAPAWGDRGFKDGRGGVSGGCLPSNQNLSLFMLTGASRSVPPRLVAKDRRAPLAARRRDRLPRIAPLQSAPLSGRV
jgi:hypothetical protein